MSKQQSPEVRDLIVRMSAEGMGERTAAKVARIHKPDRILRNIALGKHRDADNPGGMLFVAIREDWAIAVPVPGSECEAARKAERSPQRPAEAKESPVPAKLAIARETPPVQQPKELDPEQYAAMVAKGERLRQRFSVGAIPRPAPEDSRSHRPASTIPRFAG